MVTAVSPATADGVGSLHQDLIGSAERDRQGLPAAVGHLGRLLGTQLVRSDHRRPQEARLTDSTANPAVDVVGGQPAPAQAPERHPSHVRRWKVVLPLG